MLPPENQPPASVVRRMLLGAALALVLAAALELVRAAGLPLVDPTPLLVLLLVVVSFRYGVAAGLVVAAISWCFSGYWLAGRWPPELSAGDVAHLTTWAAALPALVLLVGFLRRREVEEPRPRGAEPSAGGARDAFAAGDQHYRDLFDSSPVEIWVEDFSAVRSYLEENGVLAAEDPDSFLRTHSDVVRTALERVRILDVNRQAVERLGAADKAELMRSLGRVFTDEALEAFERELVAICRGESRLTLESRSRTLDGRMLDTVLHWEVQPGHEHDLARVLVSVLDVTEQRALRGEIERIERLETVGKLAGGVAHDFNNRLTVILTSLSLLRRELAERPRELEEVERIEKAAHQAAELTRHLLAFGRRQILRPTRVDINEAVRVLCDDLLARTIPETIALRLELDAEPATAEIDRAQLEQVLSSLVVNAQDAMPDGGDLEIATRWGWPPEAADSARAKGAAKPGVLLSVRDTGKGMDAETLAHCFEPFFTTKSIVGGSGLGLSTAYGIVQQSGGSIWAESRLEEGSTFFVFLPGAAADVDSTLEAPMVSARSREGARILLVEDDDAVRSLVGRMLRDLGYSVSETQSPIEALAMIDSGTGVDLLLTDVVMPEMSGYALAERVARRHAEIAILMMSGYARDFDSERPDLAIGFLQKPFTRDKLAHAVRAGLGG